ncbi:MAG: sulfotransferase [Acidimicrobiales bacterium]
MTDRQKILFIGGLGRSGSTLIEKLLNELDQTFAVGETVHLWERGVAADERCGCGAAFSRCDHWEAVGQAAFGGWDRIDLDEVIGLRWSVDRTRRLPAIVRAHRRGPDRHQRRYLDHLRPVLVAAADVAGGAEVLLESSKHLSTAALLALDPALDVRVLHLVRDPRGVAHSWTKRVARPEADGEIMPIYRPGRTAARWVTDNAGFEALGRIVPTLTLRYEDALADPVATLRAVAVLAGLRPEELDLRFIDGTTARLATPMHSAAGNPLRFGSPEITLRCDDAWRRDLAPRRRHLVTVVTAPLLVRHHYPLVVGRPAPPGRPGT